MRALTLTILLVGAIACRAMAAEPGGAPLTLEEARVAGLGEIALSRFRASDRLRLPPGLQVHGRHFQQVRTALEAVLRRGFGRRTVGNRIALQCVTVTGQRPKPVTYILSIQEMMEKNAGDKATPTPAGKPKSMSKKNRWPCSSSRSCSAMAWRRTRSPESKARSIAAAPPKSGRIRRHCLCNLGVYSCCGIGCL
jgi:hypothetical protein